MCHVKNQEGTCIVDTSEVSPLDGSWGFPLVQIIYMRVLSIISYRQWFEQSFMPIPDMLLSASVAAAMLFDGQEGFLRTSCSRSVTGIRSNECFCRVQFVVSVTISSCLERSAERRFTIISRVIKK